MTNELFNTTKDASTQYRTTKGNEKLSEGTKHFVERKIALRPEREKNTEEMKELHKII